MREPGNMSGVARVTFPAECGTFIISYIRAGKRSINVIGEITVVVPMHVARCSTGNTYDTENYSPRFRNSLNKRNSSISLKEVTKGGNIETDILINRSSTSELNDKL